MRTIANGLKPGGHFIIDYLNVHFVEDHLIPNQEKSWELPIMKFINGVMKIIFIKKLL
jgi:hypothetical protein